MQRIIRKAVSSDIPRLVALDTIAQVDPRRAEYIAEVVSAEQAWVCVVDDAVVGYAVLNRSFFSKATVDMLMIGTRHRRSGIGSALMQHLESVCHGTELWTSTNLSNTPMQKLLGQMGYEPTGFVSNLDPGDPELIYFKKLPRRP